MFDGERRRGSGSVAAMGSVARCFEALPDPRHSRNRRHLLVDIISIVVCGVIVGCEGPTAMAAWARAKQDWLKQFLQLPNGIPSRDCIRRVLSALKPEAFQECFAGWIARLKDDPVHDGSTIAIDGKTLRRSHDQKHGLGPLHLVSAWATRNGLSLGQVATEEKSNEIRAIPELLERLDVKGALVTIDAMGCQKDIARKIVDAQGDYLLAVKDNQPKLHEAIQSVFSDEREPELVALKPRVHSTSEAGHGRKDDRHYVLTRLPDDFPLRQEWPGLKAIGMAVRTMEQPDGSLRGDTRYFISSKCLSGRRFASAVRGHWRIENSLHWVLDVVYNEDQSRTRQRRLTDNLAWVRRFAISLLKRHPSDYSIKGKIRMANWSDQFLMQVVTGQGV